MGLPDSLHSIPPQPGLGYARSSSLCMPVSKDENKKIPLTNSLKKARSLYIYEYIYSTKLNTIFHISPAFDRVVHKALNIRCSQGAVSKINIEISVISTPKVSKCREDLVVEYPSILPNLL